MQTEELLQARETTHGDFSLNAIYAQGLRTLFRSSPQWVAMRPQHQEALDMIATKVSRILSGHSDFVGHWEDVEGYARLAREACRQ